jgi:hypothetical protein
VVRGDFDGYPFQPLAIEGVAIETPPSMQNEYTKFKQSEGLEQQMPNKDEQWINKLLNQPD